MLDIVMFYIFKGMYINGVWIMFIVIFDKFNFLDGIVWVKVLDGGVVEVC